MARLEIIWDDGYLMSRTMPAILDGMVDETTFFQFCDQLDVALLQLHTEQRRKQLRLYAFNYGLIFIFALQQILYFFPSNPYIILFVAMMNLCWFLSVIIIVVMAIFCATDVVEQLAVAKLRMICEEMSSKSHAHVSFQVVMVPMPVALTWYRGCCASMSPSLSVDHICVSVSGVSRDSLLTVSRPVLETTSASNEYQLMEQAMV